MTNGLYSSDLRGLCLKKLSTLQNLPLLVWQNEIYQNSVFLISSNFESTVSNPNLLEMKYEENNFSFHIIPKLWQILKKVFGLKVISSSINLLFLRSARFVRTLFIDFVMIEKLITPVNKASFVSKNADGFFLSESFFFLFALSNV